MNSRTLLVVGISLLVIALLAAGLARWQGGVQREFSKVNIGWPNTEELVTIEVDWPRAMHANESAWVTVSLAPKSRLHIPDFANVAGEDDVIVTADLVTPSFDLTKVMAEPQSVRGKSRVSWLWMITTKYPGYQALGALLHIERRMKGSGALKDHQFLYGAGTEIAVRDPSRVWQLEGLSLIAGAMGLLLVLPRPVEAIIRRIEAPSRK